MQISTIRDGLIWGLWSHAFESVSDRFAPWPAPAIVKKAAADLEDLYEKLNGEPVSALMKRDGGRDAGDFGERLARAALGEIRPEMYRRTVDSRGVVVGRRTTIPAGPYVEGMLVPTFEVSLKGDEFSYEGGFDGQVRNPGAPVDPHRHLHTTTAADTRRLLAPLETRNPPRDPHEVPHVKTVAEVRRILAKVDACAPGCPGWAVFNEAEGAPEIQVCDECMTSLHKAMRLSDDDVAMLPEARQALAEAEERGGPVENPAARRAAYSYEPIEPMVDHDVYIEERRQSGDTLMLSYKKIRLVHHTGRRWMYTDELGRNGYTTGPFFAHVERWPRKNPGGIFTDKGEKLYQQIKAEYAHEGEKIASELAERGVFRKAKTTPGLLKVGVGRPPGVPNPNR